MRRKGILLLLGAAILVVFTTHSKSTLGEKPSEYLLKVDTPLQYSDLVRAGFKDFKRLKDDQRTAFYQVYPPDNKMLTRAKLGPIEPQSPNECIFGEAPPLAEAQKKFPLHYPMMGRMESIKGVFEWMDRRLIFRTEDQLYRVDEYHILHRLESLGVKRGSDRQPATISAVWMVNTLDGLRIIYMQEIVLRESRE